MHRVSSLILAKFFDRNLIIKENNKREVFLIWSTIKHLTSVSLWVQLLRTEVSNCMDNYEDRRCKVTIPAVSPILFFCSPENSLNSSFRCAARRNLLRKGAETNSKFSVSRERSKAEEDNEITRRVNVQPDRGQRGTRSRDMYVRVCVSVPHVFPYIFAPAGKKERGKQFF